MKGDFSRITFKPDNHYSRVLYQQGRVTLDADPNEQSAILLHYLRTLARDLIGPYAGPVDGSGFELVPSADNTALMISAGRYYVDGILCESDGHDYAHQPDWTPQPPDPKGQSGDPVLLQLRQPEEDTLLFLYLDVWERHVTWIEDDGIREVALNGPDTCTRAKVVWQVKPLELVGLREDLVKRKQIVDELYAKGGSKDQELKQRSEALQQAIDALEDDDELSCSAPLVALDADVPPRLAAQLDPGLEPADPCEIAPDALYRGSENQLYRIEIQRGGKAGEATFKWSRDNGSVATSLTGITSGSDASNPDYTLRVGSSRGFEGGDWIEISDEAADLAGDSGLLLRVVDLAPGELRVAAPASPQQMPDYATLKRPKVRRWNQRDNDDVRLVGGAVPVLESTDNKNTWIDIENGVQVRFAANGDYRAGDYWLIPARIATGGIEWPTTANGQAQLQRPVGVEHHHAPLGWLRWNVGDGTGNGNGKFVLDGCRCQLQPINSCALVPRILPPDTRGDGAAPAGGGSTPRQRGRGRGGGGGGGGG